MKVLVVDNYDSFTYNLVQYFGELGAEPIVIRNDELAPVEAVKLKPDRLVISPGPGTPDDTGYSVEYLRTIGSEVPTLGVCLGHQTIVATFGGTIGRAPEPRHGKMSIIDHDGRGVFEGLPRDSKRPATTRSPPRTFQRYWRSRQRRRTGSSRVFATVTSR